MRRISGWAVWLVGVALLSGVLSAPLGAAVSMAPSATSLQVSPAVAMPREQVVVTAKVPTEGKRRVILQKRVGSGWRNVSAGRTNRRGVRVFRFRAPRRADVSFDVRVHAPRARMRGRVWRSVATRKQLIRTVRQEGDLWVPGALVVDQQFRAVATFKRGREGRPVDFQQKDDSGWATVARGRQGPGGYVAVTLVASRPGVFAFRAIAARFNKASGHSTAPKRMTVDETTATISPHVRPLTDAENAALERYDPSRGTARFTGTTDGFSTGDLVPIPPRDTARSGDLVRVTSVVAGEDGTTLETESADLPDAVVNVPNDQREVAMPVVGDVHVTPLVEGVTVADGGAPPPVGIRPGATATAIDPIPIRLNLDIPIADSNARVVGHLEATPTVAFYYDTDWAGGLKRYSLGSGWEIDEDIRTTFTADRGFSHSQDLASIELTRAGAIGSLPVWMTQTGTVSVNVDAAGAAQVTVEWRRVGEQIAGVSSVSRGDQRPRSYRRTPLTWAGLDDARAAGAGTARLGITSQISLYSQSGPFSHLGFQATGQVSGEAESALACSVTHGHFGDVGLDESAGIQKLTGENYGLASDLTLPQTTSRTCVGSPPMDQGTTTRVSRASDGAPADSLSYSASVSSEGRYVAFTSYATNLAPGDTNEATDVFVRDRDTGSTTRVSTASDGTQADSYSSAPAISGDGRYVAFTSDATNLVPGDTNRATDVFVRDRDTGTTTRVSTASDETQAARHSHAPSISGDGRYVAFTSDATNLVPGDTNRAIDVFVRDRDTGTTTRVSTASNGTQGNATSHSPVISGDGRRIAYASQANNLVPGDTNRESDVFLWERDTGITTRVSTANDGSQARASSSSPAISGPGRYVTYTSYATNRSPGTILTRRVYVRDLDAGTTTLVSRAVDGSPAGGSSSSRAVSDDGRYITYATRDSSILARDTNRAWDVVVWDRETGITTRVSNASDGLQTDGHSDSPAISHDGQTVTFDSDATNLVSDEDRRGERVYAWTRTP